LVELPVQNNNLNVIKGVLFGTPFLAKKIFIRFNLV